MTGTPFAEITNSGGTPDSPYQGSAKINALIRAANAGQLSGFRNRAMNGAFNIWQRGTTFAVSSGSKVADRWRAKRLIGGAGATISRQAGFSGAQYCLRAARDAADTNTEQIYVYSQVESADVVELRGQRVRFSADVRIGANFSGASTNLVEAYAATSEVDGETFSPPVGFASPTYHFLTPQAASTTAARLTWPSFVVSETALSLGWTVFFSPSGTAGAADYFELTNFQLEIVDDDDKTATPFENRPIGLELALCERYCQKSFLLSTTPAQNVGVNSGEVLFPAVAAGAVTQRSHRVRLRRPMRAAPTVTLYNPAAANGEARDETASGDCTVTAASGVTADGFNLSCTGNASTAVGNSLSVHFLADAEYAP